MRVYLIIILFYSCNKQTKQPYRPIKQVYCNDFAGTWHCLNDSTIKDSLVIDVISQSNDTTYYKSNIQYFNQALKHKCPYKWQDDYLHLTVNGKEYLFTYQH